MTLRISLIDYPTVFKDYTVTVNMVCKQDRLLWDDSLEHLEYIIGVDP